MKKRLIVSADDFGLTVKVNEGIIEAYRNGIVTSASLMVNGSAWFARGIGWVGSALQSGQVGTYAWVLVLGVLAAQEHGGSP